MRLARFLCRERICAIHPFPVRVRGRNNRRSVTEPIAWSVVAERARLTDYEGERRPPSTWIDGWLTNPSALVCVTPGSVRIVDVVAVAPRRRNSGPEDELCSGAVPSAWNAGANMHQGHFRKSIRHYLPSRLK
eukprot:6187100-Pleurochrysis_carterae.AAC.2